MTNAPAGETGFTIPTLAELNDFGFRAEGDELTGYMLAVLSSHLTKAPSSLTVEILDRQRAFECAAIFNAEALKHPTGDIRNSESAPLHKACMEIVSLYRLRASSSADVDEEAVAQFHHARRKALSNVRIAFAPSRTAAA